LIVNINDTSLTEVQMPKAMGRPQGRRIGAVKHRTVSFNLPEMVIKALTRAALNRPDMNKSAELTEILTEWYKIPAEMRESESEGGEQPKKQATPA
jgi:hypothetical protein